MPDYFVTLAGKPPIQVFAPSAGEAREIASHEGTVLDVSREVSEITTVPYVVQESERGNGRTKWKKKLRYDRSSNRD